jgi:hypothetical protein
MELLIESDRGDAAGSDGCQEDVYNLAAKPVGHISVPRLRLSPIFCALSRLDRRWCWRAGVRDA